MWFRHHLTFLTHNALFPLSSCKDLLMKMDGFPLIDNKFLRSN
ncbi:hypothetical protein PEC301937_16620 [Pectobacterium carotovorum subsp. carotovorum]|nr:hypothetical protein PEC301937_16620 [Pectobacterium carotovorum subsp. carotovorum]